MSAFLEWLDGVACTAPFTCADARELHAMIHAAVPDGRVDVFTRDGDKVYVRIETPRGIIEREIDVV